jgi:TetR/AcrR family transcriptional regulator
MAQDKKKDAIIDAAHKRFSHFGVDKTTMNEIADDLSISKASLYYYFPDKLNLYAAVLEKMIEAEQAGEKIYAHEKNPLKALLKFLAERTESITKNHRILEHLRTIGTSFPEEFQTIFNSARSRDVTVISSILNKGVEAKILKVKDTGKTAGLFLDCLDGLRHAAFSNKRNFFPDKNQFYDLLDREKEVAAIFIKALID